MNSGSSKPLASKMSSRCERLHETRNRFSICDALLSAVTNNTHQRAENLIYSDITTP